MSCSESYSCYAHGCRNPACLVAKRLYQRELRARQPGAHRRRRNSQTTGRMFQPDAAPEVITAFKTKIRGD